MGKLSKGDKRLRGIVHSCTAWQPFRGRAGKRRRLFESFSFHDCLRGRICSPISVYA